MTTTTLREKLAARRQARAAHQNVLRELASYRTPREVNDLLALLDQQEGPEVEAVRTILVTQLDRPTALLAR